MSATTSLSRSRTGRGGANDAADRTGVVSSFTIVKGSLIPETYEVLQRWDFCQSKKENLDRLREENYIGATSETWLRDVAKVLNRRLDPDGRDRALVVLAQGGCPLEEWRPILLWHMTRDEFLVRDFLVNWLFPEYEDGAFRVRTDDLHDYLADDRLQGRRDRARVDRRDTQAGCRRAPQDRRRLRPSHRWRTSRSSRAITSQTAALLYLLHAAIEQAERNPGNAHRCATTGGCT